MMNEAEDILRCIKIARKKLTSITVDGISLAMIFGNFMVDEANNIRPDGSLKDCWKANRSLGGLVFLRINGDQWTSGRQRLKWKERLYNPLDRLS